MSITAADLQASISVIGATEAETSILAMDAATTAASAALADVALASVASGEYLASLGTKVFTTGVGFDGLAVSSDAAAASLSTVAAASAETAAATDTAGASLAGLAASEDTATASSEGLAAGVGLALAAITAITAIIAVKAVSMAADFQSSMSMLVTGAGEAQDHIAMVSQGILDLATTTGASTQQLSDGMYLIESAGFHGAAGLEVLRVAAEGARVGNASLADVANGVTTAMVDYAKSNLTAADATNTLLAAVAAGKVHMSDLSRAMSTILPTSAAVGVSFKDVAAAMATMTGEGTSAASAATYLRQLLMALESPASKGAKALKEIGLSSTEVAAEMRKSLPEALAMIMDALAKKFPVGSAAYMEALKNIAGGSRQMQGILELTGTHLGTFKTNVDKIAEAVRKSGGDINGWNKVQGDLNQKISQAKEVVEVFLIRLGTGLLPILSKILDTITPMVSAFSSWVLSGHAVSDIIKFITDHAQIMVPVLSGAGAIIAGLLVSAFISLAVAAGGAAVAVISATWPFIAIGAAVAGLVAIFMHFYQTNAPFKTFIDQLVAGFKQAWSVIQANFIPVMHQVGDIIQTKVMPILKDIGAWLISTFQPVWKQLSDTFHQQLIPAWNGLIASVKPLMPVFMAVGAIIGGVIAINIGILIGMIKGLVQAFAAIISGVAIAFGGVVKIISGAAQIINGILSFIVDLVTGHFDKLGADLGTIWKGISTMIGGVWDVISGLFRAAIGAILGFIGGFVSGIIGFFTHLWSTLVGHSIVPDMINGIISWFQQLPGRAIAAVQDLTGKIVSFFTDLAAKALTGGQSIITGIINGIQAGMGALGQKMHDVVNFIGSFLPHSPAKQGELSHLNEYGPSLVNAFAQGITESTPVLHAAMTHLVKPASLLGVAPAGIGPILPPSISTSVASPQIIINPPAIYLDGQRLTQAQMPYIANAIRYGTGVFGM